MDSLIKDLEGRSHEGYIKLGFLHFQHPHTYVLSSLEYIYFCPYIMLLVSMHNILKVHESYVFLAREDMLAYVESCAILGTFFFFSRYTPDQIHE
jgi:hypothetical protein